MEVFGSRWQNYMQRIEKNWRALVRPEDTVVIAGDVSWAMTLEQTVSDFAFLDALPGQKLLGKGNHDFWWTTAAKMNRHFAEHGFSSLRILYNNAYRVDERIVCGTRGWFIDPSLQRTVGTVDYQKIVNRELIRLAMSLDAASALRENDEEILPFLHFPPIWGDFRCDEFISLQQQYGIKRCYFGHIHGAQAAPAHVDAGGIRFILTSADHLGFFPLPIL
jgi:predicted phosphohydrolase